MNLKRITMLAAGALLVAPTLTSNAAVVKKDPKDVKIYINPGHGGWNSNCRPMGTVKRGANVTTATTANDTTAFFESNTNLWKCLAMYHKLVDYGVPEYGSNALFDANNYKNQHLVMSRITNGNSTDRGLSTDIAVEVEKYSPDIFISVHSNASPDETIGSNENYPLVIYRGEDYRSTAFTDTGYGKNWDYAGTGLNGAGSSYEFSKLVYSHLATIKHEPYTTEWKDQYVSGYTPLKTEHNVRGDVNLQDYFNLLNNGSFTLNGNRGTGTLNTYSNTTYYGFYGVMKHGAVGCLSEGYMHTYYPSVNRHMNKDVCAIEGISYAHAIADYFGWEKEKTGYIYGIVRDRNQTFTHTYYIPNQSTDDIYKPLNNCTVYLCDKYGNRLYNSEKPETAKYRYVTDDEYNGAFVFYDLEPGDYTLDYECAGYQAASQGLKSTIVTVKANEISYPKAFLNATGYSIESSGITFSINLSNQKDVSGLISSSGYYGKQMAAANDVCYVTYPRSTSASTNGWYQNMSKSEAAQGFQNGGYMPGWGIASDDSNNLIMACGIIYYNKVTKVRVYKATSFGNPVSTTSYKEISLSTYTTNLQGGNGAGRTDFWKASGNCYNGVGALWFTDGKTIVKININNGAIGTQETYTFPDIDSDGDGDVDNLAGYPTQATFVPYADNEYIYQGQVGVYDCKINADKSISATKVATTQGALSGAVFSSDIAYLQGHKLLVRPNSTSRDGKIVIEDLTKGQTLTTLTLATNSLDISVNAWCEFEKIDDNTLGLYVYVPNKYMYKYLITATGSDIDINDPVEVTGTVGSTEAEVVSNNYEPNITVTWEAPDSWTEQPTNYLVKYQVSYVNENNEVVYLNPAGGTSGEDYWYNAGMTEDATCQFVHEGVEFAVSSTNKKIYPLTYAYIIVPNFNCYDGEVSEISTSVTIDFVAPEPEWNDFSIEAVTETNEDGIEELKQYDATATWNGVAFDSNKEFSLQGYNLQLFRSDDTNRANPVASFSFKVSGLGELTNNVGAVLDDNGNAIENLTYSKTVDATGATINQFHFKAYDLDVLDINNDGSAVGKEFTAVVTAEYWIVDGEFVYSDSEITETCAKSYTPVAPSIKPTVYYYQNHEWGDWDADYYGNPAKGEYDKDDAYWKVYWVNMDITKPNADAPVSSYTMTLASNGKSDVTEVMLYDPKQSLGLPLITEGYAKDYVALPVDIAAETYSARSTVEATSATFTIPGNYDFTQAEEANVPMATFYVKDFDTTVNGGATDYDGNNSALNYTYTVAANYASGNSKISSTATGGATPVNGGVTTAVEEIEVAGAVNNVVVYPVPATVSVTIKAAEAIEQVAIYSAAGAVVKSLQGDGECAMTIAVDDLEVGTYFVRVNNLAPVKIAKN
ncbi:MAG: hypothetical protein IJN66_03160 [Muribaculaceae bacterium]|nr:hypothetical protein [Muribaculaceae bacterium]